MLFKYLFCHEITGYDNLNLKTKSFILLEFFCPDFHKKVNYGKKNLQPYPKRHCCLFKDIF